jgi:hypothetical protein
VKNIINKNKEITMKTVTFNQFVKDYNKKYDTNYNYIQTNTLDIESIVSCIYDTNEFELNFDNETIELY